MGCQSNWFGARDNDGRSRLRFRLLLRARQGYAGFRCLFLRPVYEEVRASAEIEPFQQPGFGCVAANLPERQRQAQAGGKNGKAATEPKG